jgi:hypothetical protein
MLQHLSAEGETIHRQAIALVLLRTNTLLMAHACMPLAIAVKVNVLVRKCFAISSLDRMKNREAKR